MTNIVKTDRVRTAVLGLGLALCMLASALPAAAAFSRDAGSRFLDGNNITWERSTRDLFPRDGRFRASGITWE